MDSICLLKLKANIHANEQMYKTNCNEMQIYSTSAHDSHGEDQQILNQ